MPGTVAVRVAVPVVPIALAGPNSEYSAVAWRPFVALVGSQSSKATATAAVVLPCSSGKNVTTFKGDGAPVIGANVSVVASTASSGLKTISSLVTFFPNVVILKVP